MLTDLYKKLKTPEHKGKDIVLPEYSTRALYLSERGEFFAFVGIYCKDAKQILLESWPYYLAGKHTKNLGKYIKGLFRIKFGCILISAFLDHEIYYDKNFKQLPDDYFIKMTVVNDCYFGVVVREENESIENEELTRQCFGLTYSQLSYFLEKYAEKLGVKNQYLQYPRITRSINRDNFCDITGLWIPPSFPYIAFNDGYDFSHVSLFGFYRFIGALLSTYSNVIQQLFEQEPLCAEIIRHIKNINNYFPFEQKVTREHVYPMGVIESIKS